jgi:hypothetical protein
VSHGVTRQARNAGCAALRLIPWVAGVNDGAGAVQATGQRPGSEKDSFRSQGVKPAGCSIRPLGPGAAFLEEVGVITDTALIWLVLLLGVGGFIVSCLWRVFVTRHPGSR